MNNLKPQHNTHLGFNSLYDAVSMSIVENILHCSAQQ